MTDANDTPEPVMPSRVEVKPRLVATHVVDLDFDEPPRLECAYGWAKNRKAATALLDHVEVVYTWGAEWWQEDKTPRWRARVSASGRRIRKDGTPGSSVQLDLDALGDHRFSRMPAARSELGRFVDDLVGQHRPTWEPPAVESLLV